MKPVTRTAVVLAAVALLALPSLAGAQMYKLDSGRTGRVEFLVDALYQNSASIDFEKGDKLKTDGEFGLGLEVGYNVNDNFNVSWAFAWNSVGYDATVTQEGGGAVGISGDYTQWTTYFAADYNIMTGPVTPFVSAGIGWNWVDTNVPDGRPVTGCWWDPWYGYVCADYYPTKLVDNFTYKLGLGVRYDVNRQFFMKAGYEWQFQDLSKADGSPSFGVWKVGFGFFNF